jgi:hypothetical protein
MSFNKLDCFNQLASLVGKGFDEVLIKTVDDFDESFLRSKITKILLQPLQLEAWTLPKSILSQWHHISFDMKQNEAIGRHILFRRVDTASLGRGTESMKLLLERKGAIWIGLDGIGKSMSTMVMFILSLQSMKTRQESSIKNLMNLVEYNGITQKHLSK